MGNLFGSTKYKETPADKALREDIERKRKEEEEQARLEAIDKRIKKRKAKGMLGSRSLFSSSGMQGFYRDGEQI